MRQAEWLILRDVAEEQAPGWLALDWYVFAAQ